MFKSIDFKLKRYKLKLRFRKICRTNLNLFLNLFLKFIIFLNFANNEMYYYCINIFFIKRIK